jgi:PhnB protein
MEKAVMKRAKASATAEDEIRALIEDRAKALRSKKAKGVVAHQAADFVQYSLAPPLISAEADAEGLEAWFATWDGPLGYELRDLRVAAGADTAFSHGLVRLSGTKVEGGRQEVWFRLTLGCQKIDGTWKIVHEHESVPFYMDGSYKAAVDLRP